MQVEQRDLVLRVNELFHDLEGEEYQDVHPEIFEREKRRWIALLLQYAPLKKDTSVTLLDVGAGTGFVGSIVLPLIQGEDSTLICADISQEMLDVSREKLTPIAGKTALRFLKMKDEMIDLPDASVDVVMMNSVLHHVPDYRRFLREIERVLKPDGMLFIGHEPNLLFMQNNFLRMQAGIIHHLTPKRIAALILKRAGLYHKVVSASPESPILKTINETLQREHLIDTPLTAGELSSLIDIHSPTAGSLHENRGFDLRHLCDGSRMTVVHVDSYNHLLKMSGNRFWKPYGALLKMLLPRSGSTFFLIAAKKSPPS
ncbi:MAG TPA: class I SAM-dependent methyltransferase [Candidatus Peribacteraceae bacterium]|nr:class I SAM-dependent methyltransferase [Candidatus Peribacteraceae bacterium]